MAKLMVMVEDVRRIIGRYVRKEPVKKIEFIPSFRLPQFTYDKEEVRNVCFRTFVAYPEGARAQLHIQ